MRTNNVKSGLLIITLLILCSSFLMVSRSNDDFKIVKNLDIYFSLFRELNFFYVDETDPEKLIESSIDGMLKTLDPYTTFIPESEGENFQFMTTGEYGGIGALIRRSGDYTIIAEPYEGFPAARYGLKAGDTIVSIDGLPMVNRGISDISEKLKGKPNSEVSVVIRRYGTNDEIEKTLVREKITISNVPYYGLVQDDIGYIRLTNFTRGAYEEVKNALTELRKEHGIQSLILDIRDNPGGLLIEAVNITSLFVGQGQEIVRTRGRLQEWDYTYKTKYSPVDTTIPIAILVSRVSASASEIVAGAIQDLDRGVIIGQRTFGKGLVQTTRDLSYNTKLKVTTAKYYIPSGRCIQALDYSNRNEDGSVGHIPDSLISEFRTRNGRTVRDGGGIIPDFQTERKNYSNITNSLLSQNIIFNFATIFAFLQDSIPEVSDFIIDQEIFDDFKEYVTGMDFSYETRSEEMLQTLIETARREKYYSLSQNEFSALEKKLTHDNLKDLETFSDEIKELLKEEICCRYYYQKGRVKASTEDLPELQKAIEILNDPETYAMVLSGSARTRKELSSLQ